MIRIALRLLHRQIGQEGYRASALDRARQLALMSRAAPRDPARNDLAAVADEVSEPAHILVVDEVNFVGAKLANLPPAEPAALDGLLDCRNRSLLPATPLERNVVLGGPRLIPERLGRPHGGPPRPPAPPP